MQHQKARRQTQAHKISTSKPAISKESVIEEVKRTNKISSNNPMNGFKSRPYTKAVAQVSHLNSHEEMYAKVPILTRAKSKIQE